MLLVSDAWLLLHAVTMIASDIRRLQYNDAAQGSNYIDMKELSPLRDNKKWKVVSSSQFIM